MLCITDPSRDLLFGLLALQIGLIEQGQLVAAFQAWTRNILGGREAMIESPVLQELKAEWTREAQRRDITNVLVARFGPEAKNLGAALDAIDDEVRLDDLVESAALCPDLESFRKRLSP